MDVLALARFGLEAVRLMLEIPVNPMEELDPRLGDKETPRLDRTVEEVPEFVLKLNDDMLKLKVDTLKLVDGAFVDVENSDDEFRLLVLSEEVLKFDAGTVTVVVVNETRLSGNTVT